MNGRKVSLKLGYDGIRAQKRRFRFRHLKEEMRIFLRLEREMNGWYKQNTDEDKHKS